MIGTNPLLQHSRSCADIYQALFFQEALSSFKRLEVKRLDTTRNDPHLLLRRIGMAAKVRLADSWRIFIITSHHIGKIKAFAAGESIGKLARRYRNLAKFLRQ